MSIDLKTDMEVSVRPIEQKGNLHGFASITIAGIRIDDFKIVNNKDGELFVGMPSKEDKKSETGYRNTVHVDKDTREDFNNVVMNAFRAARDKVQDRSAYAQQAAEKPLSVAEQVAKAAKEAEKSNAELPEKKTVKTREARGE
jgi:DNA-binding cell septation regulator SpoVG